MEGEFKGCKYEGNMSYGKMDGEGLYSFPDGSSFKGTFKNNEFYEGKFIDAESGEYFVGKFKDGVPSVGTWYNSKHEILNTLK